MNNPAPTHPKIFLSHASEDKQRVLQVYAHLAVNLPAVASWLDIFEITGGDSLIDKIAGGMDSADKFFIFLSPVSVTKPWVQAELKRALNHEISGLKPGFIVPVKFGELASVPAFLEDKRYIDLDILTLNEWIAEFQSAIDGRVANKTVTAQTNIKSSIVGHPDAGMEHVGQVVFEAVSWAEEIAFQARTSAPAERISYSYEGSGATQSGPVNLAEMIHPDRVGYALPGRRLSPGQTFRITVFFPEGTDFRTSITGVDRWDGSQSTMSGTFFS